jgi:hypothetical protein
MPMTCYSYPLICFNFPADSPPGGGDQGIASVGPGLRRTPMMCFGYPADVPRSMPLSCFSYSGAAAQPATPGPHRMTTTACFKS